MRREGPSHVEGALQIWSALFSSRRCPRLRFLAEPFLAAAIAASGACTSGGSDGVAPETAARDNTPTGRLPLIDMHLHAFAADANGPPPMALCVPVVPNVPPWDRAAHGDGKDLPEWPRWDGSRQVMRLNAAAAAEPEPHRTRYEFLDDVARRND